MTNPAIDPGTIDRWEFNRAAIVGAGAMGVSLAAMLGQTMPVVLVCRDPDRAAQVIRDGVRTTGIIEASARPIVVRSVNDLPTVGGVSAIFVATKTTAIAQVAADLRPLMHAVGDQAAGTFVISYQNGIESGSELMAKLGHPLIMRMVLTLGAIMDRDTGSVDITLNQPPHIVGSLDPTVAPACQCVARGLTQGGLETIYDRAIEQRVWEKGVVNAAVNPVAALVNASVGEVIDSPSWGIVVRLLAEGIDVARAEGIPLPTDFDDRVLGLIERARNHVPSMVDDIRGGRESEVGQLNRQIIEHGRRLGRPTPTHDIIDALIETFDWKVYHSTRRAQRSSQPE